MEKYIIDFDGEECAVIDGVLNTFEFVGDLSTPQDEADLISLRRKWDAYGVNTGAEVLCLTKGEWSVLWCIVDEVIRSALEDEFNLDNFEGEDILRVRFSAYIARVLRRKINGVVRL